MVWIYSLPAWIVMPLIVVVFCTVSGAVLHVVRTYFSRNAVIQHNDVAGPILATIGTVLAVMLSFMVAGVWQQYDAAAQTAQTEASAISDLHHLADGFPANEKARIHREIDRYARLVVTDEWPLMRHGRSSARAHDAAYAVQTTLIAYWPKDAEQQGLQARGLDLATVMLDARRNRIMANREGIPMVLWATMLVLGAVTIAFSFYFRVDSARAHYIMTVALAGVIAITFALIAELDYPFRGDVAVSPGAFNEVMHVLHPHGGMQD
ncbi:MAG: hypothetical protein ABR508_02765 [Candidatus Baltobacteraceae bacterium]